MRRIVEGGAFIRDGRYEGGGLDRRGDWLVCKTWMDGWITVSCKGILWRGKFYSIEPCDQMP